jgi:geranylgeranyl diphosphate synthase type II
VTPRSTDAALTRLLSDGAARATAVDPEHARLWASVADATEGGKRFRPALVIAAHDALGGTAGDAAAQVGAAVELLHTAFVVHDDVIDGDDVRRGRLNVSGTFAARARAAGVSAVDAAGLARAAGILAGDLALTAAIRAVATCGAPADVVPRLLDLFDAALHTTAAGELADVRLSLAPGAVSLEQSLVMEEQKTSAYSFTLPLQAGAVLAGAEERVVARLTEAGRLLGVAFQLVDDLLGVWGDPSRTGKSTTNDLRTRKQTPLLVHATTTPQWEQIQGYVGRDLDPDELAEVRRLLEVSGSRGFVGILARTHLAEARAVVEGLGIPEAIEPAVTACLPHLAGAEEAAA